METGASESYKTRLLSAVCRQLNQGVGWKPMLQRVVVKGAGAGWPGFSCISDTVRFYNENTADIWQALCEETIRQCHSFPLQLTASLRYADKVTDSETFKNFLSWFALWWVARRMVSYSEKE